jgi:uncharacterized membrane protein
MSESSYAIVLFVHVLAAVVLLGSSLLAPITRNVIWEASSLDALRRGLDVERRATRWNPAAALVLLGSGVYLGSTGWWTEAWFYVSLAAWVGNALLAALVVQRATGALMQAAAPGGDAPTWIEIDAIRRSPGWNMALAAMLANDLAILYVMISKPGLVGAIAVVAAANLLSPGLFIAARPRYAWHRVQPGA